MPLHTATVHTHREMCDVTMFTMEDLDVCLARRLRRDIVERKRDVESVLHQYQTFVKPGFETFVRPSMLHADFIIPRARDNKIAIDMLARDISAQAQAEIENFPKARPEPRPATGAAGGQSAAAAMGMTPPPGATLITAE